MELAFLIAHIFVFEAELVENVGTRGLGVVVVDDERQTTVGLCLSLLETELQTAFGLEGGGLLGFKLKLALVVFLTLLRCEIESRVGVGFLSDVLIQIKDITRILGLVT